MKKFCFLSMLLLINGALTYGWVCLKARDRELQRQLNTLLPTPGNSAQEASSQSPIFPWEKHTHLADTQANFETLFRGALQSNIVWSPTPKPHPIRKGSIRYSGNATAFFFYPRVQPFLKALADHDMPLWVRSLQLVRRGLSNAGFHIALTFDALALNETTSTCATPPNE